MVVFTFLDGGSEAQRELPTQLVGSGDRVQTQSRVFLKLMLFKKCLFFWLCQVSDAVGGI